jgi:hypothetical protein
MNKKKDCINLFITQFFMGFPSAQERAANIKLYYNPAKSRTWFQNRMVGATRITTYLQIGIMLYILMFHYQQLITLFTYQVPGSTAGELFYDLGLHRWLYLAFSFNLIDLLFSLLIGRRIGGSISFFINVAAWILNTLIIFVIVIVYIPNPIADGSGATANIARNPSFYGVASVIANAENEAIKHNPYELALDPPVTLASLSWGWSVEFLVFAILYVVYHVAGTVKTIACYFVPGSLDFLRKGIGFAKQHFTKFEGNILPDPYANDQQRKRPQLYRNAVQQMDPYIFYTENQISWHSYMLFFHWLIGIGTIAWFGWFQQNVKTWPYTFELVTTPTPHTVLRHFMQVKNFIFYGFLGVNILGWLLNAFMLNFRKHHLAIVGSAIGLFGNMIVIVYAFFVYGLWANMDGYGTNIANDRRIFCCLQRSTPVLYQFFSNVANKCTNTQACTLMYEASEISWYHWDFDYIALNVIFICNMVFFGILFVYHIQVYYQIKRYKFGADEKAAEEQKQIDNDIKSNIYQGSDLSYESYNYNLDNGMDPNQALIDAQNLTQGLEQNYMPQQGYNTQGSLPLQPYNPYLTQSYPPYQQQYQFQQNGQFYPQPYQQMPYQQAPYPNFQPVPMNSEPSDNQSFQNKDQKFKPIPIE